MALLSQLLILLISLAHLYFLYIETFAWTSKGPKTFRGFDADFFKKTKAMAGNQGIYNGFLAAGLIWSLLISDVNWSKNVALFFLSCIVIAGVYGAATVQKSIFIIQSIPAILAIASLFFLNP